MCSSLFPLSRNQLFSFAIMQFILCMPVIGQCHSLAYICVKPCQTILFGVLQLRLSLDFVLCCDPPLVVPDWNTSSHFPSASLHRFKVKVQLFLPFFEHVGYLKSDSFISFLNSGSWLLFDLSRMQPCMQPFGGWTQTFMQGGLTVVREKWPLPNPKWRNVSNIDSRNPKIQLHCECQCLALLYSAWTVQTVLIKSDWLHIEKY